MLEEAGPNISPLGSNSNTNRHASNMYEDMFENIEIYNTNVQPLPLLPFTHLFKLHSLQVQHPARIRCSNKNLTLYVVPSTSQFPANTKYDQ